jgi:hypothetical protein
MRFILVAIVLFFNAANSTAQQLSHTVDSLTQTYLKRLPVAQGANYSGMLENRKKYKLFQRIDTTHCQYLYIEESYCLADTTAYLVERYFDTTYHHFYHINPLDRLQLPAVVFQNGQEIDFRYAYYSRSISGVMYLDRYENYYTLDSLLQRCKYLKDLQELSFDPTPKITYSSLDYAHNPQVDLSLERKKAEDQKNVKRLQQTYQIVTLIDKRAKKVQVSIQTPAKNPVVNSYFLNIQSQQW